MDTQLITANAEWLEALEAFAATLSGLVEQQIKLNETLVETFKAQKEALLT